MQEATINIAWAIVFMVVGSAIGIMLVMLATLFIPKILSRLTPNMNEDREIAQGNQAVAEYFGRIVASSIIGISIVIAASILAGVMVALY